MTRSQHKLFHFVQVVKCKACKVPKIFPERGRIFAEDYIYSLTVLYKFSDRFDDYLSLYESIIGIYFCSGVQNTGNISQEVFLK